MWREHFVKQANVWLDAIGNQMLDWVVKSVAWDNVRILIVYHTATDYFLIIY